MKNHTVTRPSRTGDVTLSVEINFDIPKKGDTLYVYGYNIVCTEDAKLCFEWDYDKAAQKFTAKPKRTKNEKNELVFGVNGYSWRPSEYFEKA